MSIHNKPADDRRTEAVIVRFTPPINTALRAEARRLGISLAALLIEYVKAALPKPSK